MEDFFRELAADAPRWNFIWMYEDRQQTKILSGLWMTIKLSVLCLIFSVLIGLVGAWMQGSRSALVRAIVQSYIQFFRNTPPLVQLLFFYFALGQFTPVVTGSDGWTVEPIITNVGWAIISLSLFAGALNVEIFRSGIEAVQESTIEAAQALARPLCLAHCAQLDHGAALALGGVGHDAEVCVSVKRGLPIWQKRPV